MLDSRVRWAAARLLVLCALSASLAGTGASAATAAPLPRMLLSAAHVSTTADRALVRDARNLKRCLAVNPRRSSRCAAARRALQRAGRRLSATELHLARIARNSGAPTRARSASRRHGPRTAPHLFLSGHALKWTRVAGVRSYLLARKLPGQPKQFSVITATSVVPPPMPGMTVRYSVRTTAARSAWANELAIAYAPAMASASSSLPTDAASTVPATTIGTGASQPSITIPAPEAVLDPQAAPQLTVSGKTLSWSPIAGVSAYVLVRTVSGHAPEYSVVSSTTATPSPAPGATVRYSVRTAIPGSAWAAEVSIAYPPSSPTPTPAPPVESPSPPSEESPAPSGGFQPGINAGPVYPGQLDLSAATTLGAKRVRVEFPIESTAAQLQATIAGYAAIGVQVAPVATFRGRMPSAAEAQNLASWASTYGPGGTFWASRSDGQLAIQTIEFGNETDGGYQYGDNAGEASYTARAQLYAVRLKEAAEAISAAGPHVGLLADCEDWTGDWMNGMFAAVPNLGRYVGGWVSHPYGNTWKGSLETVLRQTSAHGAPATTPIDITEWGLASDGGRCLSENYGWNPCMSYQEAAETLNTAVAGMRQMLGSRLGLFMLYQIRDQAPSATTNEREAYFGALQHEMQPKGAYTAAVSALMGS